MLDIEDNLNEGSQQEMEMGETSGKSKVYQNDEVDEGTFGKSYQEISDDVVNIKLHKQFLSDDEKRNYNLDEENS